MSLRLDSPVNLSCTFFFFFLFGILWFVFGFFASKCILLYVFTSIVASIFFTKGSNIFFFFICQTYLTVLQISIHMTTDNLNFVETQCCSLVQLYFHCCCCYCLRCVQHNVTLLHKI